MKFLPSVLITASLLLPSYGDDMAPMLEVLPLNSTLREVTIPRFDKDLKRVAYLKSDLMEILADGEKVDGRQNIMVDCTGIRLRMPSFNDSGDIHVDMNRARYRITPGVLTVREKITVNSDRFALVGSGGVFHLDSRRGFLFGPLDCEIFAEPQPQANLMNHKPALAFFASASLSAQETVYKPTSQAELLEIDRLALSSAGSIEREESLNSDFLAGQLAEATNADELLGEFSRQVDSNSLNLLIQNPPKPAPAAAAQPPIKDPSLTIHCDGGGFFDGNANVLVFLRNVVVKESRFTLKAAEEMKVFFSEAPPKEGEKPKDDDRPDLSIGDVKTLIATGGVNFTGVDQDGNPIEATAQTASYDEASRKLILKDGKPTFWLKKGDKQIQMISADDNGSIAIDLSGENIHAVTSKTGWTFAGKDFQKEN